MSTTRRSSTKRPRAQEPVVQRVPALPSRMAATDALFWYAESALPEFRPIIAGLYRLDRVPIAEQIEAGIGGK